MSIIRQKSYHFFSTTCDDRIKQGPNSCILKMSAATDKSRFYLEQSVPELKEYERKEIFSKVFHQTGFMIGRPADNYFSCRKKLHRSSRSVQISSTRSMHAVRNQQTLFAMHNMR